MSEHPDDAVEMHKSGLIVRPLYLSPADVRIEDIAYTLSNIARFGGNSQRSVGKHSCDCEDVVRLRGASSLVRLHALLHDASEAYLGDMPSPIKRSSIMHEYRMAHERAQAAIMDGLEVPQTSNGSDELVHWADKLTLCIGAEMALPSRGMWWREKYAPMISQGMVDEWMKTYPWLRESVPQSVAESSFKQRFLALIREVTK